MHVQVWAAAAVRLMQSMNAVGAPSSLFSQRQAVPQVTSDAEFLSELRDAIGFGQGTTEAAAAAAAALAAVAASTTTSAALPQHLSPHRDAEKETRRPAPPPPVQTSPASTPFHADPGGPAPVNCDAQYVPASQAARALLQRGACGAAGSPRRRWQSPTTSLIFLIIAYVFKAGGQNYW
eukprot:TRINITY_DN19154_c1_g2_i1.p1 TRINITY_DN19154_c1_g2~~TRINITY_DN19154_c1_g2_i1.p1  ORF type:complete len:179 (-),score=38.10 TRINITY_DN19154_c1_g2_i1:18-554(-)